MLESGKLMGLVALLTNFPQLKHCNHIKDYQLHDKKDDLLWRITRQQDFYRSMYFTNYISGLPLKNYRLACIAIKRTLLHVDSHLHSRGGWSHIIKHLVTSLKKCRTISQQVTFTLQSILICE